MLPWRMWGAMIALVSSAIGTTTDAAASGKDYLRIRLLPARSPVAASSTGYAVLERAGNKTGIDVAVSRLPSGVVTPVHLYAYLVEGRCAKRLSRAYPLDRVTTVMGPSLSQGMVELEGRVPIAFGQLRKRDYALSIHLSPADGGQELLCGDVS